MPTLAGAMTVSGNDGVQKTSNQIFAKGQTPDSLRTTWWDVMAKTSLATASVLNIALFASPFLSNRLRLWITQPGQKKRLKETLSQAAARFNQTFATSERAWFKDLPQKLERQVEHLETLGDKQKLANQLTRWSSFANLFQLNTGYQVGINTRQPSKTLASISGFFSQSALIYKLAPFLQCWTYLNSFFWFAGETNDIRNNNSPEARREYDLKRIFKFFSRDKANVVENEASSPKPQRPSIAPQSQASLAFARQKSTQQESSLSEKPSTLWGEVKALCKYMGQDFQYALSAAPWKDLGHALENRQDQDWKKPASYQTAIGAQLNLMAFVTAASGYFAQSYMKRLHPHLNRIDFSLWKDCYKVLPNRFLNLTKLIMVPSIISYVPVLMRAFQNKGEADGILTILGVPLITISQIMNASFKLESIQGLLRLGSPVVNEAKRINSQKYRAQVQYLQEVYQKALQDPTFTAEQALVELEAFMADPKQAALLEKSMGEFKIGYLQELFRTIAQDCHTQNKSFAEVLLPKMQLGA